MIAKIKKQFDGIKFLKKIVIFCISFITIYTVVAIVFQAVTGDALSDTLTERVFTTLIGELCITGLIKIVENVIEKFKKDGGEIEESTEPFVYDNFSDEFNENPNIIFDSGDE
jgi:hypothetical protein